LLVSRLTDSIPSLGTTSPRAGALELRILSHFEGSRAFVAVSASIRCSLCLYIVEGAGFGGSDALIHSRICPMQVSNNGMDYSANSILLDVRPPSVMDRMSPAVGSETGGTPLQVPSRILEHPIDMWGCKNLYQERVLQPRVCANFEKRLQRKENHYTNAHV